MLRLLLRMAPLILFLLATVATTLTKACVKVERDALLAFKAGIVADPVQRLSSWHRQSKDCCRWSGVVCDNTTAGHVVELNLQNPLNSDQMYSATALQGKMVSPSLLSLIWIVSTSAGTTSAGSKFQNSWASLISNYYLATDNLEWLSHFSSLRFLDLGDVNLSKASHNWLPQVSMLFSLRELHLAYCGLDSIPYNSSFSYANLTSLTTLDLSSNYYLAIDNLEWLSHFSSLRFQDLSEVNLSKVSHNWLLQVNMLPSLRELHLRYCDLHSISYNSSFSYANLTSLTTFDLSGNYHLATDNLEWLSHFSSLRFLDLSEVNLSKTSHNWLPQVNMLPSLRELHLQYCDLHIISYNSSFSYANLTSLTTLDLSGNNFNSTLPNWLWKLKKLSYLDLGYSEFSGTIPEDIGNLTSLTYQDVGNNDWEEGFLPRSIANLANLDTLFLNNCNQKEEFPHRLMQSTSLTQLDLSSNLFTTGDFSDWPLQMTNLAYLDLSNMSLTGPLPTNIGKLSNLNYLDLSSNSLQGNLTELHFANLTRLDTLFLTENFLTISVDQNWTPPFQLSRLELGSCKVGPPFPGWLQSQTSIYELNLFNTSIIDTLPDWFGTFIRIFAIDLSHNKISGTLPTFWENMTNLESLNLGSNLFHGPLPASFPPNIWALDLSNNSLSGPLPSNLSSNMSYLEFLHLSDNRINGSIPSYLCDMDWLKVLGLSSNHLSGEIPNCWRASQQLLFLDLANNELSGEIPTSIGYLIQIQYLHLNNNSLHGRLPSSLQNCSQLAILDLGDNKFLGTIPS